MVDPAGCLMKPIDRYWQFVDERLGSKIPARVSIITKTGQKYEIDGTLNRRGDTITVYDEGHHVFVDANQIESIEVGVEK
jgi:hypothetical protein